MNEVERLANWMHAEGHNVTTLAAAVGMSYDGVYQILNVRGRVSPGFKLRFIQVYGADVAAAIFDAPRVAVPEAA